jgi:hypothetical protein
VTDYVWWSTTSNVYHRRYHCRRLREADSENIEAVRLAAATRADGRLCDTCSYRHVPALEDAPAEGHR